MTDVQARREGASDEELPFLGRWSFGPSSAPGQTVHARDFRSLRVAVDHTFEYRIGAERSSGTWRVSGGKLVLTHLKVDDAVLPRPAVTEHAIGDFWPP